MIFQTSPKRDQKIDGVTAAWCDLYYDISHHITGDHIRYEHADERHIYDESPQGTVGHHPEPHRTATTDKAQGPSQPGGALLTSVLVGCVNRHHAGVTLPSLFQHRRR